MPKFKINNNKRKIGGRFVACNKNHQATQVISICPSELITNLELVQLFAGCGIQRAEAALGLR
jgi:hypothetical protein